MAFSENRCARDVYAHFQLFALGIFLTIEKPCIGSEHCSLEIVRVGWSGCACSSEARL